MRWRLTKVLVVFVVYAARLSCRPIRLLLAWGHIASPSLVILGLGILGERLGLWGVKRFGCESYYSSPCLTAAVTHSMTSSSITSSEVSAEKPRICLAFETSGTLF